MVEEFGRSFELGLASWHYLKHFPLRLPSMMPMGWGMLSKKRMSLIPKHIKLGSTQSGVGACQGIGGEAMRDYILYPGCSMESSARAYYDSLKAVCKPLGMNLKEIDDWNCCGATEYLGISQTPAYALIARNLAIAAKETSSTRTLVAPCSACYLNLAKADHYMNEQPKLGQQVNEALAAGGLSYQPGSLDIRHLLDVIVYDIGLDTVEKNVIQPLTNLRIAPYLGCMVPRPDYGHRCSDHEQPVELDILLKALGAQVIDFPLKTECCGGHMTQIGPAMAFEMIRRLIAAADEHEADTMVTICPMCQMNLDAYQGETNHFFGTSYHMPICSSRNSWDWLLEWIPRNWGSESNW